MHFPKNTSLPALTAQHALLNHQQGNQGHLAIPLRHRLYHNSLASTVGNERDVLLVTRQPHWRRLGECFRLGPVALVYSHSHGIGEEPFPGAQVLVECIFFDDVELDLRTAGATTTPKQLGQTARAADPSRSPADRRDGASAPIYPEHRGLLAPTPSWIPPP